MNPTKNLGMPILGVWLIITGWLQVVATIPATAFETLLAVSAITAGVLILLRR